MIYVILLLFDIQKWALCQYEFVFETPKEGKTVRTPLVTKQGYDQLKSELDTLWRTERPEITKKVTWAASLGDRSENADI